MDLVHKIWATSVSFEKIVKAKNRPIGQKFAQSGHQGCQIFLGTIIQKGEKYTKVLLNYQKTIIRIFQMDMEYTNLYNSKALQNLPKLGILV
jgi:hypothetical protein